MIEAFYFDQNRLFGCFHPATEMSNTVAVFCPPLFDEYRRSYRALFDLAVAIAAEGTSVLRFDYYGTGDSLGQLEAVTVEDWLDNIRNSIDEALALSGASKVNVLGVRYSAALSILAAHPQVAQFVFWDPMLSSQSFIEHHRLEAEENKTIHQQLAHNLGLTFTNRDHYEVYHCPPKLLASMLSLRQSEAMQQFAVPVQVIQTSQHLSDIPDNWPLEQLLPKYDWPYLESGVLMHKPALAAIAKRMVP